MKLRIRNNGTIAVKVRTNEEPVIIQPAGAADVVVPDGTKLTVEDYVEVPPSRG